jgi:hypothetical protein
VRYGWLTTLVLAAAASAVSAQSSDASTLRAPTMDALTRTAGPAWSTAESRHFIVHLERPVSADDVTRMLDSLEAAWSGALALLGATTIDETRTPVFVTHSRTRFGRLLPPEGKGLTTSFAGGGDVILLVMNDSVRAYTRHEVMHLVSRRVWGVGHGMWLVEGLATFADGRCQGSTIRAVGRDLLASRRTLITNDLLTGFEPLWRSDRASAYVLTGTLVDYLWASHGRDGVRRLWQGADTLSEAAVLPGLGGELTAGWRAYVARVAGTSPGLESATFARLGCG